MVLSDSCFPLNRVSIQLLAVLLPRGRFLYGIANTFTAKKNLVQIYLVLWSGTEWFFCRDKDAGNRICYFAFAAFWDQTQFWLHASITWNIKNRLEISFLIDKMLQKTLQIYYISCCNTLGFIISRFNSLSPRESWFYICCSASFSTF